MLGEFIASQKIEVPGTSDVIVASTLSELAEFGPERQIIKFRVYTFHPGNMFPAMAEDGLIQEWNRRKIGVYHPENALEVNKPGLRTPDILVTSLIREPRLARVFNLGLDTNFYFVQTGSMVEPDLIDRIADLIAKRNQGRNRIQRIQSSIREATASFRELWGPTNYGGNYITAGQIVRV